jgi:hypothetical protein
MSETLPCRCIPCHYNIRLDGHRLEGLVHLARKRKNSGKITLTIFAAYFWFVAVDGPWQPFDVPWNPIGSILPLCDSGKACAEDGKANEEDL